MPELALYYFPASHGSRDHWVGQPDHGLARYYERLEARASFAAVFVDDPRIP